MIISAKGYSRMMYHQKWHREAEKRGLRNPWSYSPKKPLRTEEIISLIEGVEIPATKVIYGEATEEEIKLWEKSEMNGFGNEMNGLLFKCLLLMDMKHF